MSEMENTELSFAVRLIGLAADLTKHIDDVCAELRYTVRPYFKDKSLEAVIFPLDEKINLSTMSDVVARFSNGCLAVDILISVSSNVETQIIDLPAFVVEAIKILPVKVSLSYTIFADIDIN